MDSTDQEDFGEVFRVRSRTWPSRDLEPHNSPVNADENGVDQHGSLKDPHGLTTKKSGSRRNAWGNLSYADLITKAIQSTPDKRLTLSQIYDWMVQNVPYFKDKGDSTSSAGWKNSIRHNLSLHSRFMRIQNEGTGKSSWWVLNPDAKPGKTPRRRAGSMETKKYENKRGRIRKKIEAMANGETLSPGGSDDILDNLPFGDFRSRASSNASTSGRLSPIHAAAEPDLHENQVPPMSPIPWEPEVSSSPTLFPGVEPFHELVNSLVIGMKLSNPDGLKLEVTDLSDPFQSVSSRDYSNQPSPFMDVNHSSPGMENHYNLPAPPPYPKQQQQQQKMKGLDFQTPNFNSQLHLQCSPSPVLNSSSNFQQSDGLIDEYRVIAIKQEPDRLSPVHEAVSCGLTVNTQHIGSPDRSQQGSPCAGSFARLSPQSGLSNGQLPLSPLTLQVSPHQTRHLVQQELISTAAQQQQQALHHQATHDSILREALTRGAYRVQATNTSPTYSPLSSRSPIGSSPAAGNINNGILNIGLTHSANVSPHHQPTPQLNGMTDSFLIDNHTISSNAVLGCNNNPGVPLDIDIEDFTGLDYDMEQVIRQELKLEGTLDFNFDSGPATSVGRSAVH